MQRRDLACGVELVDEVASPATSKNHHPVHGIVFGKLLMRTHRKVRNAATESLPLPGCFLVFDDASIRTGFDGCVDEGLPFWKPGNTNAAVDITHHVHRNLGKIAPRIRRQVEFADDHIAIRTVV